MNQDFQTENVKTAIYGPCTQGQRLPSSSWESRDLFAVAGLLAAAAVGGRSALKGMHGNAKSNGLTTDDHLSPPRDRSRSAIRVIEAQ